MALTFTKTDGDLRAVMETMFRSPEFFSEGAWEARIKSPLDMAAGTIRAIGGEVTDAWTLVQKIADMGEALYGKTEPNGYPDVAETWLSAAGTYGADEFRGVHCVRSDAWRRSGCFAVERHGQRGDCARFAGTGSIEADAGCDRGRAGGQGSVAGGDCFTGAGFARFRKEINDLC